MRSPVSVPALRRQAEKLSPCDAYEVYKAATEIEQLRAELARARLEISHRKKMSELAT